jgi:hypothetical protein
MNKTYGPMDEVEAEVRLVSLFHKQKLDWISEGTVENRNRWHNLKYYTWVEQQGKEVEELNAQRSQDYWRGQQEKIAEVDRLIEAYRKGE